MHISLHILLLAPAITGLAMADLPRKVPVTKYTGLWTNSPFTSKPPPPEQGPQVNPLEDYALAGVSPITGGYRVTMLSRKNPTERIVVDSDKPSGGFKIIAVNHKAGDPLGTVVRMSSGSITGTVAFDEAMLTLTPPPAAAPKVQLPPGVQPPLPGQPPQRQPRPRVVPPPTAANAAQARPQIPPQVQPQTRPPIQPSSNRPDRRRQR